MSTPSAIAAALLHAFDTGDVDAVDTLFAPDIVDHNPYPGFPTPHDTYRAFIVAVQDGFTDAQHKVVFQTETDDGWVATHFVMTGRHTGPWFGAPASGRDVRFAGIDLARVVDGRITEIRHIQELLQLQAQIGSPNA